MSNNLKTEIEDFNRNFEDRFKSLYDNYCNDSLDGDGYPTDGSLELISAWHYNDPKGWFDYIKSLWYLNSWGWAEGECDNGLLENKMVYRYDISTAGWSGNEDIIRAMQQNHILWSQTWIESRRGGHYVFEIEK